jgi:hypothetical protein
VDRDAEDVGSRQSEGVEKNVVVGISMLDHLHVNPFALQKPS